jgi:hypothetical protein
MLPPVVGRLAGAAVSWTCCSGRARWPFSTPRSESDCHVAKTGSDSRLPCAAGHGITGSHSGRTTGSGVTGSSDASCCALALSQRSPSCDARRRRNACRVAAIAPLIVYPTGVTHPSVEVLSRQSPESGLRGSSCAVNWHLRDRSLQARNGRRFEIRNDRSHSHFECH